MSLNAEKMGPVESCQLPLSAEVRERLTKWRGHDPTKASSVEADHHRPVVWISPFEDGPWRVNALPLHPGALDGWLREWRDSGPLVLRFGTMTLAQLDALDDFWGC